MNKFAVRSIVPLLAIEKNDDKEPLFVGQRGPLTVPSVHRLVESWCRRINLKGNYGSHTLRKTFGYHQRVTFGVGLPELMEVFNYSSQKQIFELSLRAAGRVPQHLQQRIIRWMFFDVSF